MIMMLQALLPVQRPVGYRREAFDRQLANTHHWVDVRTVSRTRDYHWAELLTKFGNYRLTILPD
jgi:hypothetical protein